MVINATCNAQRVLQNRANPPALTRYCLGKSGIYFRRCVQHVKLLLFLLFADAMSAQALSLQYIKILNE
ncbi:unnamed protein product [Ceratitis capitata]|uniref:(Mediterranean fruit fly) hypothetical protein n=1 Tax=Ceratitis capitata TaxID=7213 RepID=A0A811UXU6_CERCA|nr:unnamed protein product [Ceratitis capitata]